MYLRLRKKRFFLTLFFWIIAGSVKEVMTAGGVTEHMAKIQTVKNRLLKDYDKTIRPVLGESNTTEVRVGFIPRQIIQFDEELSLLSLDSVIWMTWTDPRLKWETTEYSGLLHIPTNLMWLPDLTVHNSHSARVNPAEDVLVVVEPTGKVYWVPPVLTQTTCSSDAENYPLDETTCTVVFGSWAHDGWEIDFQQDDHLYMGDFANVNPRWELQEEKAGLHRNVHMYECCPEPYLSVEVTLPLRRRPPPELEATRAPCVLAAVLALALFWLPPDSGRKLPLGGAIFGALCLLLVFVAWNTKHPLAVPRAVSFIQSTMYIVATVLLLQLLVIGKLCSLEGPARPPPAIMHLLNGPLGKWACLRCPLSDDALSSDRIQLREDSAIQDKAPTVREEWLLFAAALEKIFFLVLTLATVLIHHL